MAQPFHDATAPAPTREPRATLSDTLARIRHIQAYVQFCAAPDIEGEWIDTRHLALPASAPLADLMARFQNHGFAPNKKAAAASLLLRFGWAGGFAIASYLVCGRVPYIQDFALNFSPKTLMRGLWIKQAQFAGQAGDALRGAPDWIETADGETLRARLLESLIAFTEPLIESQHRWSRFSRHALWSMATSSWAAQFASIARQTGDVERGTNEAQAMFALGSREIGRAAPELYEVREEDMVCTCQKRAACCLYFKSPGRNFCASCPILPKDERLERNRSWVRAQRPVT
jgi:hypothetical protein